MGFLSGFGEGLQKSAALEQAAQIQKKKDLMEAQIKLADVLIGSQDPDLQAQGFAIYSDPSHPFSMEKPHPNLEGVQNVLQALGPGAGGKAVASGEQPPGMIGMLNPANSPLVQNGVMGDQGTGDSASPTIGEPPPAPSPMPAPAALPPQAAAMTTNPPATQGGKINPVAAASSAPSAPPPPPTAIAQAAPPPAPPEDLGAAAIAEAAQAQIPKPGLNSAQQQDYYKELLKQSETLKRARAAKAAGAPPEEIRAILAGREGTQVIATGMRETGREADRDLKKTLAGDTLEQRQKETDAKISIARDRLKQDWAKHMDSIAVRKAALLKGGSGAGAAGSKSEIARLTKLQIQGEKAIDGATEGISGIENLRTQYKLYAETPFGITTAYDKAQAWNRFSKAVSSEGQRIARAMTAMTLPGNRGATEARIKAMERELAGVYSAASPSEGNYRLDNMELLIRQTEEQLRQNIEDLAAHPPEPGKVVLPPPRPPKDLSNVPGGPGAPKTGETPPAATTPKIGDEKTFKSGKRGRWDGTGWVAI